MLIHRAVHALIFRHLVRGIGLLFLSTALPLNLTGCGAREEGTPPAVSAPTPTPTPDVTPEATPTPFPALTNEPATRTLVAYGPIEGRILKFNEMKPEPVEGAEVCFIHQLFKDGRFAGVEELAVTHTLQDGQFTFKQVMLGPDTSRYLIRATAPGYAYNYAKFCARPDGPYPYLTQGCRVRTIKPEIYLFPEMTVEGRVDSESPGESEAPAKSQTPVAGAMIYGFPITQPVRTGPDGRFRLEKIEFDQIRLFPIHIYHPDYADKVFSQQEAMRYGRNGKNLVVVKLERGTLLKGMMLDEQTGQPLGGIGLKIAEPLCMCPYSSRVYSAIPYTIQNNPDGQYMVRIPTFVSIKLSPVMPDEDGPLRDYYPLDNERMLSASETSAPAKDINFRFKRGVTIAGRAFRDAQGTPAANMIICISKGYHMPVWGESHTDAEGRFSIRGLRKEKGWIYLSVPRRDQPELRTELGPIDLTTSTGLTDLKLAPRR